MADSILCSINMAGGAINIYYDTILTQNTFNSSANSQSISIPSNWKIVIIMTAQYHYSGSTEQTLLYPYPIFNNTNSWIPMPVVYNTTSFRIGLYHIAYVNSNYLRIGAYTSGSYIVAG